MRTTLRLAGVAFALGLTSLANASVVTVNFETEPILGTQPSAFGSITMQTYTSAGLYSITGGVALGNPSFLAAFPGNGSAPNAYGTTDIADPSLLDTITLNLDSLQLVTNVTGLLFNGQTWAEDYVVRYFSGVTPLTPQTFRGVQDTSLLNGFRTFAISSTTAIPITRVEITTPNVALNGYGFFVDSIQFTTNPSTGVPEPSTLALLSAGLLALGYRRLSGKRLNRDDV